MNVRMISGNVTRSVMISMALVATAHKCPAPVQEITDTPTPTQTVRPVKASKAHPSREAASAVKPTPAPAAAAAVEPGQSTPLTGKWSGTIQTVPWGPWTVTLTVSAGETSVTQQINTDAPQTTAARHNSDMLQARFPAGLTTITWSLTPLADGTAQIRFQAFANDFSTIFHRVANR